MAVVEVEQRGCNAAVVLRADGEVEVDSEEKLELEGVELTEREVADACPPSIGASYVFEKFGRLNW